MSTAKFEKLIDLIINEDQERAEQLFHEIVVEKSREIYESLMEDEDLEESDMGGLLDEIEAEESMSEEIPVEETQSDEMDADMGDEMGDEMGADMGDEMDADMGDEMGGEMVADMGSSEPASKDDIMDLEDKLDEILSRWEEEFGSDEEGEEEGEEEFETGEEEGEEGEEEGEEESGVMESVQLSQVGGKTYDKFGKMGDDGDKSAKSPVANKGQMGMAGKPVNFSGKAESVPTSPNANTGYLKRGGDLMSGAKNAVDGAGKLGQGKGESTPKPKNEDPGKSKSPVAESKKIVKKIVRK
jgi:hypothetical protein